MDCKYNYLILKNRAKLEKLIRENAPYKKILRQSKRLDKYIIEQMNAMNKDEN